MSREEKTFNRLAGWASILSLFLGLIIFYPLESEQARREFFAHIGQGLIIGAIVFWIAVILLAIRRRFISRAGPVSILENCVLRIGQTSKEIDQKLINLQKLEDIVPIANGLARELDVLCGLFLQGTNGVRGDFKKIICTLTDLTSLESMLPSGAKVIIRRPEQIRETNNTELTQIMRANITKGVEYSVIGDGMPSEWVLEEGLRLVQVDERLSSLVLPSFGMVLYVLPKAEGSELCKQMRPEIWYEFDHNKMKMGGPVWISGFVLLPITDREIMQHGYLALLMHQSDVDELIHRIYQ